MKISGSYIRIVALTAAALAAFACAKDRPAPVRPDDGRVRVEFRLPFCYADGGYSPGRVGVRGFGPGRPPGTRSDHLEELRDLEGMLPGIEAFPLEPGSTLWLTYSHQGEDGEFSAPDLQAYQVRDAGGYHSLYPCRTVTTEGVDKDGNNVVFKEIDTGVASSPLYLAPGVYKFKMISPAMKIIQEESSDGTFNWKLPIDNGMYFCSTDGRYVQTVADETLVSAPDLSAGGDHIQYITLRPMVHQTAKLDFRITKGEHVDSLSVLPAGVEVSGLQNPGLNAHYYWTSENIADTLVMKMGDKRSWATLRPEGFRVDEKSPDTLIGDIGVLPTDSRSTTIIITFNLLVNGIPTQYVTTLNEIILQHGHSYKMNLKVWKEDGITLFTWQYQSWTGDLELD